MEPHRDNLMHKLRGVSEVVTDTLESHFKNRFRASSMGQGEDFPWIKKVTIIILLANI